MKKAEWYAEKYANTIYSIADVIRIAQEDAIRETVKECRILSQCKYYAGESGYLDEESIKILADKLIKEL